MLVGLTCRLEPVRCLRPASTSSACCSTGTVEVTTGVASSSPVLPPSPVATSRFSTAGTDQVRPVSSRPGAVPVIVMSGYTEETLDVPGMKDPIALLQKPFTPRELRRRIREVLDR